MIRTAFAILLLAAPAAAQTVTIQPDWSHGACFMNGIWFPARDFGQCHAADRHSFAQTMPPANLQGVTSGGQLMTTAPLITNMARSCPSDRTMVMTGPGAFKCAKDLTDPE